MPEYTITALQEKLQHGGLTSAQLVELYLDRIEKLDSGGPAVHAVIETNPDAPAIAAALDGERQAGKMRGPLHGIPVLIKDNIDTHDRMQTSAGSLALAGSVAPRDAFLVERLRAAGAVLLGKTNLSEWANFRSSRSTSGWSSRGGQTRNPYALDRSPCGSSSGSGAAVAADFCVVAVGTETDGSVVCPASINGIVGLKPTLGLVSRSGIVPIAHSQDTAGPMARTVTDAALLLGAMVGPDKRDPATAESASHVETDYTRLLRLEALKGVRIGVSRNYFGFHPGVDQLMEHTLEVLKSLGAILIDPANLDTESKFGKSELEVLLYEFKTDLNLYLSARNPDVPVKSLADVIAFNDLHADSVMPYFGQEHMLAAQKKGPLTQKKYLRALARDQRYARSEGIDAVLQQHSLDALVAPTSGPAWSIDWVNGDHYGGGCSSPAAVAGYPHVTVPAGYVFGLPVGLSFFGPPWTEARLLSYAYAFEQATKVRKAPQFLPTLDPAQPAVSW